jgi:RNA polymerase sigma-70 factor, ECF subfamily
MPEKNNSVAEVRAGLGPLYPRLWRFCLVISGNAQSAADLAQATCLRALEKSLLFEPGSHLDRWLFRMAQRIWLNEMRAAAIRRGGGMVALDETEIADEKPGAETNIFAREVFRAVGALPEALRATVLLVYVEGHSYREAADVLEIPIGTVMSRLSAARKKLAERLEMNKSETG